AVGKWSRSLAHAAQRFGSMDARERMGISRRDARQYELSADSGSGGLRARRFSTDVQIGNVKRKGISLMDDYALVLNAGSSSLKFCVFQRPGGKAWRLAARGQIEGIGTSPRLSVKDADLQRLADDKLDASVRNGRDAIDVLATWLRTR